MAFRPFQPSWYKPPAPQPTNPFVSMGTLAMMNQAAQTAPASFAAPAAPAGAAAPPGDNTPDIAADPNYQARIAAILKRRDDAKVENARQRGETIKGYGIEDTSDPYSKAKLLQESFVRNKAATTNSLASRGQLYSGAMQNAQDTNQRNFQQSDDSMRKSYREAIAAFDRRNTDLDTAAQDDVVGAGSETLARILASRPDADIAESQVDVGPAAGLDTDVPISTASLKPKSGYSYIAKSGARKGQSYNVVKSGNKTYHVYANGKRIRIG